jgi:hypothetical protein
MRDSVHLIHIGDLEERKRAIIALIDVREAWLSFPGDVFGITGRHLEALRQANPPIQFETAKKAHLNGQNAPVQSN